MRRAWIQQLISVSLVGGILTGITLKRSAELRSIISDLERFNAATYAFKAKYEALLGDISNATSFWGAAGGNSSDNFTVSCYSSQGTGTQTCNGNGTGLIDPWGESLRYWQHLSNAGFVQGTFSGVAGPAEADDVIIDSNVPKLRFSEAGVSILDFGMMDASRGNFVGYFPGYYGNSYFVGRKSGNQFTYEYFATPSDVLQVDQKMDDGLPGMGKIRTSKNSGCASSTDPVAAIYQISNNSLICQMYALNQF